MNPVLLKSLIGVGALGTTVAASVGGYYWLSPSPKTIGEKIKGKTPLKPYDQNDANNKASWTSKVSSYKGASDDSEREKILKKADVDEEKLFKKCEEILKTPLNPKPAGLNRNKWLHCLNLLSESGWQEGQQD